MEGTRIALVTGGAKGIGRETARIFGKAGYRVYIAGRDARALDRTCDEFSQQGIHAFKVRTDVRDRDSCRKLIEFIEGKEGRLDCVINNAGMSMRGPAGTTDLDVVEAMVEINYLGAVYITHYALPLIRISQGSILFISSLTALHGLPQVGPYGASKMALKGYSESLRIELAGTGVHIGLVYVGLTENDPDKRVYGSDGALVPLVRPTNRHTQQQVAERILHSVKKRKRVMILTPVGRLADVVFRFFPGAAGWVIIRWAQRSRLYLNGT